MTLSFQMLLTINITCPERVKSLIVLSLGITFLSPPNLPANLLSPPLKKQSQCQPSMQLLNNL